ncbi:porin [Paludisphaera sp.]|uniref:porin n=1 Tax=Paludisphaera sp. TaxID=2017432 RepID=UPI00301BA039
MSRRQASGNSRWLSAGFAAAALLLGAAASAQDAPPVEPIEAAVAAPRLPDPIPPATPREAALEERVRQLEEMVQRLSTQMQAAPAAVAPTGAGVEPGAEAGAVTGPESPNAMGVAGATAPPGVADNQPGTAAPDVGTPAAVEAPSATGGVSAPGQSLPPNPAANDRYDSPAVLENKKVNAKFGPGFELRSDDDEYILQFHNLTQMEYRGYEGPTHATARDSFLIPRQWWMFSGRVTKPVGYFVSFAHGFDALTPLDIFLDFDVNPAFRIRAGRVKTPFTYEFLVDPIQGLIQPERSIFFNNFGQNRDIGAMAFGRLFNGRLDYMAGIFNGSRNGFVANTDSKFVSAFVNWKPFNNAEDSAFQHLNVGGSVFGGTNDTVPVPQTLRTVVPIAGNAVAGVPFLAFNNNVREIGPMTFWDLHAAWYYRQLALIGEWGSGFQDYALNDRPAYRTRLPVQSFYVQAGYLLTGETRSGLGVVRPLKPFNLSREKFGLGAWELTGRYQLLDIGGEVFSNGLSDPNLWANRLNVVDLGFNWHINQYLKFMFNWERTQFNNPVFTNVGHWSDDNDLFIARVQLFF